MTLAAFASAWFLHFPAALSPGPAVLLCARLAATEGMRVGTCYGIGVGIGGCFWALAALPGLSVLFEIAPGVLWGFKIAGGLFLISLGWRMWRHTPETLREAALDATARTPLAAIRLGVLTQLANPKTAVFFGAIFVSTVPHHPAPGIVALLLAMVFLNEAVVIATFARLFSSGLPRRLYVQLKTGIDRSFGGLLAVLGLDVALQ